MLRYSLFMVKSVVPALSLNRLPMTTCLFGCNKHTQNSYSAAVCQSSYFIYNSGTSGLQPETVAVAERTEITWIITKYQHNGQPIKYRIGYMHWYGILNWTIWTIFQHSLATTKDVQHTICKKFQLWMCVLKSAIDKNIKTHSPCPLLKNPENSYRLFTYRFRLPTSRENTFSQRKGTERWNKMFATINLSPKNCRHKTSGVPDEPTTSWAQNHFRLVKLGLSGDLRVREYLPERKVGWYILCVAWSNLVTALW